MKFVEPWNLKCRLCRRSWLVGILDCKHVKASPNVAQTRTEIVKWLREFGLESGSTSVVLVTDAKEYVSDLIAGALLQSWRPAK